MFNIKGTLYCIYDGDNVEYYCLHRYDRMNPVRIPRDIANKYLIKTYIIKEEFDTFKHTFKKGTILVLDYIDQYGFYKLHDFENHELYTGYNYISNILGEVR